MSEDYLQVFEEFIKVCWQGGSIHRISRFVNIETFRATIAPYVTDLRLEEFAYELGRQRRVLPGYGTTFSITNHQIEGNTLTVYYSTTATYDGIVRQGHDWELPISSEPYTVKVYVMDVLTFNEKGKITNYHSRQGVPRLTEQQ